MSGIAPTPGAVRAAERESWLRALGRAGLAAQGISYAIVAVLAIQVALGTGGKTTSRQGAFRTLADDTAGRILLVLLALGFTAYALWRAADAVLDRGEDGDDAKGLGKRAAGLAKAGIYVALTVSVCRVLAGGGGGGASAQKHATAGILGWPGGRELVGAAAVAVIGAGCWNAYRGLARTFEKKLRTDEMSRAERLWVGRIGLVGLCARGVVFAVAGWFLLRAAIEFDPKKAIGLGGALAKLAQASYGQALLGVTSAGLLCFGLFGLAQARYRDV